MTPEERIEALERRIALLEQTAKERSELLMTIMKNIERFTSSDVLHEIREEFCKIHARLDKLESL